MLDRAVQCLVLANNTPHATQQGRLGNKAVNAPRNRRTVNRKSSTPTPKRQYNDKSDHTTANMSLVSGEKSNFQFIVRPLHEPFLSLGLTRD
jgi:hypothetical protein